MAEGSLPATLKSWAFISHIVGPIYDPGLDSDGGFFLICKDLGRMFNQSFPALPFFFFF